MGFFLVTYDLSIGQSAFMDAAVANGWTRVVSTGGRLHQLPNTTIWGRFDDRAAALASFDKAKAEAEAVSKRKITLEKRYISSFNPGQIRSDKTAAIDPRFVVPDDDFETCKTHQMNGVL